MPLWKSFVEPMIGATVASNPIVDALRLVAEKEGDRGKKGLGSPLLFLLTQCDSDIPKRSTLLGRVLRSGMMV